MTALIVSTLAMMPAPFRAPAYPLVVHTPYLSTWCVNDRLTDDWPKHWTGGITGMAGLIRIDGKPYRWMGPEYVGAPALAQTDVQVSATSTRFTFEGAGIRARVTFLSPLLAEELDILARPVTYVTLDVEPTDGKAHRVEAYLDVTGEWCVEQPSTHVRASRHRVGGLETLSMAAAEQKPLSRAGDRVRIDWGTLYLASPSGAEAAIGGHTAMRRAFVERGGVPGSDDLRFPRAANDDWPVLGIAHSLGSSSQAVQARWMIALDEGKAIEWLGRQLPPFWARENANAADMLSQAERDYSSIKANAEVIDGRLWRMAEASGGAAFAQMCALAYRQCLGGHGLVQDVDGDLLMFSKENTSNGCMATVDVTFPAAPFFLVLNPKLLEAQIRPVLEYASMPRWKFPFAPHDLGTYPLANGQVYGGGEKTEENQMPVEESANMILMVAGLAQVDADFKLDRQYWPVLTTWAKYLEAHGFDPANQLCTDDFTGHLAHNTNLSIKAICALGAYGAMAERIEGAGKGERWMTLAKDWARQWMEKAADGDHTRLAFDRPGTWSLKYNLLWDRLLGLGLFPDSLIASELKFYAAKANRYGTPLDNRAAFTKTDWLLWVAALAPKADRGKFIDPVAKWLAETPSRVGFTDWYDTQDGRTMGMHTRTVIGGIYAPIAMDRLARKR